MAQSIDKDKRSQVMHANGLSFNHQHSCPRTSDSANSTLTT